MNDPNLDSGQEKNVIPNFDSSPPMDQLNAYITSFVRQDTQLNYAREKLKQKYVFSQDLRKNVALFLDKNTLFGEKKKILELLISHHSELTSYYPELGAFLSNLSLQNNQTYFDHFFHLAAALKNGTGEDYLLHNSSEIMRALQMSSLENRNRLISSINEYMVLRSLIVSIHKKEEEIKQWPTYGLKESPSYFAQSFLSFFHEVLLGKGLVHPIQLRTFNKKLVKVLQKNMKVRSLLTFGKQLDYMNTFLRELVEAEKEPGWKTWLENGLYSQLDKKFKKIEHEFGNKRLATFLIRMKGKYGESLPLWTKKIPIINRKLNNEFMNFILIPVVEELINLLNRDQIEKQKKMLSSFTALKKLLLRSEINSPFIKEIQFIRKSRKRLNYLIDNFWDPIHEDISRQLISIDNQKKALYPVLNFFSEQLGNEKLFSSINLIDQQNIGHFSMMKHEFRKYRNNVQAAVIQRGPERILFEVIKLDKNNRYLGNIARYMEEHAPLHGCKQLHFSIYKLLLSFKKMGILVDESTFHPVSTTTH